ncbi:hypothetical protein L3X38_031039 [Prunus dulcis]|uniref:Uncharacterized protein n=1 Tax=Prunus dulcis TaxID=3755 RepID=A0AAD4YTM7_PRUDU|nr:hypothetical protein L3X38_031039 [Prunus dulcis]
MSAFVFRTRACDLSLRSTIGRKRRAPWTLSGQDNSVWSAGHGFPPGLDQTEGRVRQEKGEHEDDPVLFDTQSRRQRSVCN